MNGKLSKESASKAASETMSSGKSFTISSALPFATFSLMNLVAFSWIDTIVFAWSSWFLMKSSEATTTQHGWSGKISSESANTWELLSFAAMDT